MFGASPVEQRRRPAAYLVCMHACMIPTSDKILDVSAGAALDIQGVLRHPPVVTRVRGGQGEASGRQRQRPCLYWS